MKRIIIHKKAFFQGLKDIYDSFGRIKDTYKDIMRDPNAPKQQGPKLKMPTAPTGQVPATQPQKPQQQTTPPPKTQPQPAVLTEKIKNLYKNYLDVDYNIKNIIELFLSKKHVRQFLKGFENNLDKALNLIKSELHPDTFGKIIKLRDEYLYLRKTKGIKDKQKKISEKLKELQNFITPQINTLIQQYPQLISK